MVFRHTSRARGLSRPPSCSGTVQTTIVLVDYPDHHRARGLSRPPSCSDTVQTTIMLGDCSDHSHARGLPQPLFEHCSETALLGYM